MLATVLALPTTACSASPETVPSPNATEGRSPKDFPAYDLGSRPSVDPPDHGIVGGPGIPGSAPTVAGSDHAPGAVMCRYALPDDSTQNLQPSQAQADLLVGQHDAEVVHLKRAVFVPVPGSNWVQIVVSDDPALCQTLSTQHMSPRCSIDASIGNVPNYAYVTAALPTGPMASTSVDLLALAKGGGQPLDVVQWHGVLRVDGALTSASTAASGRYFACDGIHGLLSSGVFVASYCGSALPACS